MHVRIFTGLVLQDLWYQVSKQYLMLATTRDTTVNIQSGQEKVNLIKFLQVLVYYCINILYYISEVELMYFILTDIRKLELLLHRC